jgi:mRNA-degrading endonuclease RelE of RelBE toxin-antitoxin system
MRSEQEKGDALAYRVEFSSPQLGAALDPTIREYVALLATLPRPLGAKRVGEIGRYELWRIRVRDARVLYRIDEQSKAVTIVGITRRRDPYSW